MSSVFPFGEFMEVMPVDVFEGGGGHIVLCQEWPSVEGERYLRIMLSTADAERVAKEISAIVSRRRQ